MVHREPLDVTVPGARLVGSSWAGPDPAVVFLHSGVTDRRSWYAVADELAGEHRLIGYDRRGYGETPPGSGDYRDLDDLLAVLDELGEGPVVVVGNSMGGELALDLALAEPSRVASLLLLAPAISGAPDSDQVDPATLVLLNRREAAVKDDDDAEVARQETWLWLDGPTSREGRVTGLPRMLALEMSRTAFAYQASEDAGASGMDAWSRLSAIAAPAIVVCGDLDVPVLIEQSEALAKRLPNAEYRTLTGAAHLPSLEQPEAVADLVRDAVKLASG